ncbi:MAG TPA: LuxR C-terminal-related transcriptional regulator [Solirubrobacteraceae bacterium]|nr:LuxR C-terminal-related transcriptional regulator [Solirubrobacteraceae bacterium]
MSARRWSTAGSGSARSPSAGAAARGETIAAEAFSGPLGAQLRLRLERAAEQAAEALAAGGTPVRRQGAPGSGSPEAEDARPAADGAPDRSGTTDPHAVLIARCRSLIEGLAVLLGPQGAAEVSDLDAAIARLRARYDARIEVLAAVRRAVDDLRGLTSPAAILERAPAALCASTSLRRAILSITSDGRLVASSAHFEHEPEAAARALERLRAGPIRLEHPLIETELMRRRRATIVVDAQLHPRVDRNLVGALGCTSYVAAPLLVGSRVIGMLHADRGPSERLDVLDRDALWEFTSLLAQAYETAALRRALRLEREQMRQFLDWVGARSAALTDAPVRLSTIRRASRPVVVPAPGPGATPAARDDRLVFERLLTRRELEVLRLMADGCSNRSIAQTLVISEGTVKFHVNSILRKLRVSNRAEAVARYLRLLGMRAP